MKEMKINPKKIWGFLPNKVVPKSLVEHINKKDWGNIPLVPIFTIPERLRKNGFEYILMDGNTRRNVAEYVEKELPVALYEFGEIVDTARDRLAHFKHSNHPRLYERLLKMFELSC